MLVRFRTNFGSMDARALKDKTGVDLNFRECTVGSEHDLSDAAIGFLGKIVEVVEIKAIPQAPAMQAVPPETKKKTRDE